MSSAISFLDLLILLTVLAMIVGGIACIIIGVILRRKTNPDGGACGKCGYSVNQLESMTCPECGADLREVGIKTAGGRGMSTALIVVGIVLVLGTCGCGGVGGLFLGVNVRAASTQRIQVQQAQNAQNASVMSQHSASHSQPAPADTSDTTTATPPPNTTAANP